tara:strand:- start:3929 stop:5440 length:1512 start_codon:yes stop_codon:yes gene_type:complete
MATKLATPGVYIEEKSAFGNTVVSVPTAVPAFVGYTEKAARGTQSLLNVPTRITSFSEYNELFGGASMTKFEITSDEGSFNLRMVKSTRFMMYDSMRLFFNNGGSTCYIVSVGDYSSSVSAKDLSDSKNNGGIISLEKHLEPTILVVPDSTLLSESDCYSLQADMLSHCGGRMKNRFAILDVFNGDLARTHDDNDVINKFREGVGSNFLSWGAAYYPYVNTNVTSSSEVNFMRISNPEALVEILTAEVEHAVSSSKVSEAKGEAIKSEIAKISDSDNSDVESTHAIISSVSSKYNLIMDQILNELNVMPPSSAMAGAYTMVDGAFNVGKAPANISLGSVVSPCVNINSDDQEDMNVPLNGKAVNAIRSFTGKGTLVWGARTMDGNSQDWRYVSVRRTMTFLEQSIKSSAEAFVFSPNNSTTWSTLRATVSNFLNNQWVGGLLVGSSPDEAFQIEIGLGSTMNANDILDGILKMTVKVAVVRPAEFIVLTFEQKQQGGGGGAEA